MKCLMFPKELKVILTKQEYHDIFKLCNDGFIIEDIQKLTQQVLGKHFKHKNYLSFKRQLNKYGFQSEQLSENSQKFLKNDFNLNTIQQLKPIQHEQCENILQNFQQESIYYCLQIKQSQINQIEMNNKIKQLAEQQVKIKNTLSKTLIKMLTIKIKAKKRFFLLQDFLVSFYDNLKENQFSNNIKLIREKYLRRQHIIAVNETQLSYDENYFSRIFSPYIPFLKSPNISLIYNYPILSSLKNKQKKKILKLTNKESTKSIECEDSLSNISGYFDL